MALRWLILLVLVAGCGDREIERHITREWQAEGTVSCSYSCWQYSCHDSFDWDEDGDRECGLHFESCDGHQRAMIQFREWEITYETKVKGQAEAGHRKERIVRQETLNRLEACR